MRRDTFLCLFFFGLCVGGLSHAHEVVLEEVAVEANAPEEETLPTHSAQEMAIHQERFLTQALRQNTSLQVISQGDFGNNFLFFRGIPSQGTTILRDGVPLNTQSEMGRSSLLGFTSLDLEEVRVLPGVSKGSHALGGTVELVTKQGRGRPSSFSQVETGSYRTTQGYHALQGERGPVDFFISGTLAKTGLGVRTNKLWGNRVADEGALRRMSTNVGIKLSPQVRARFIGHLARSESALDQFLGPRPEVSTQTLKLFQGRTQGTLTQDITQRRSRTLTLHQARFEMAQDTFFSASQTLGLRYGEAFPFSKRLDGWAQYEGVQDSLDQGSQSRVFQKERVHTATLGARHNHPYATTQGELKAYWAENGSPEVSYLLGLDVPLPQDTLVFLKHGRGIQRPLLMERFGNPAVSQIPNPALVSQKSLNFELGLSKSFLDRRLQVGASLFYTRLQDLFAHTQVAPRIYQTRNLGRHWVEGAQGTLKVLPHAWVETNLSYTLISPRVGVNQDAPTQIARHQLSADLVVSPSKNWSFFTSALWRSPQQDYDFSFFPKKIAGLPAALILRAGLTYDVRENIKVFGRVENLLNKAYETSLGYGARGRAFLVGGSVQL